jgi:hypothetical protein
LLPGRKTGILVALMDVVKLLADLRVYRVQLDEAITAFDRLARRRGEKRGRPLAPPPAPQLVAAKSRKRKPAPRKSKSA